METLRIISQAVKSVAARGVGVARQPVEYCNKYPKIFGGPMARTGIPEIDVLWDEVPTGFVGPLTASGAVSMPESVHENTVLEQDAGTPEAGPSSGEKPQLERQDSEERPNTLVGTEETPVQKKGLTWWQTAFLMTGEFVGTSTHTFPHIFATLGFIPTILTLLVLVGIYWLTCMTVWMATLRNPTAKNICELGAAQFQKAWVYWLIFTLVQTCYLLIMAVHIRGTVEILEVTSLNIPTCGSIIMSILATLICYVVSLPRRFSFLAMFSAFAVFATLASAITAAISLRVNGPLSVSGTGNYNYPDEDASKRNTFIWGNASATLSQKVEATLLIVFAYLGQPTIPTIVDDMREPRDFPKALAGSLVIQTGVFSVYGALAYHFVGVGNMRSPVIRSLQGKAAITCALLMMPATISQGALFASVDARMICDLIKFNERWPSIKRPASKRAKRYSVWGGLLFALWFVGSLITQCVPNFTGLLSIVAAIPGSSFFFIYGGLAFFFMRYYDRKNGFNKPSSRAMDVTRVVTNALIILLGVVACLCLGSWASISTYINAIQNGQAQKPFSCHPVAAIKKPEVVSVSGSLSTMSTLDPMATDQPVNEKIWGKDEWAPLETDSETVSTEPTLIDSQTIKTTANDNEKTVTATATITKQPVSEETEDGHETVTSTTTVTPTGLGEYEALATADSSEEGPGP